MDLESLIRTGAPAGLRARRGRLDGLDDEGRILFRPDEGGDSEPVTIGVAMSDGALVKAARVGQRALVLAGAPGEEPVLVALLRERVAAKARDAGPGALEVHVDGETLVLRADQEIELRCGKSRLKLRADGRVMLNGSHIVSASTGPHRIKGATIALN
ncbi:MAG: hypothetical protein KC591_16475 [Gemmatimonadetes bacterium]|nr:hypothetical protein [Gemmatimonadota bacterium]